MRAHAFAVALSLLTATPQAFAEAPESAYAASGDEAKEQARRLHREGGAHYAAGRYQEAYDSFRAAFALFPHPQIAGNLAECETALGLYSEAAEHFRLVLEDDSGAVTAEQRALAETRLRAVNALRPVDVAPAPPSGAPVAPPAIAPLPPTPWIIVGAGVAAAGFAFGIAATVVANDASADADHLLTGIREQGALCPAVAPECPALRAQLARRDVFQGLATGGYAVGGAALAAATIAGLLVFTSAGGAAGRGVSLVPVGSASESGVRLLGRF